MLTTVLPQPGAHHGRVIHRVKHEPTGTELRTVLDELAADGIQIEPVADIFHTLHLWALTETTTEQEVRALRAFADVTDARLAWHKLGAS